MKFRTSCQHVAVVATLTAFAAATAATYASAQVSDPAALAADVPAEVAVAPGSDVVVPEQAPDFPETNTPAEQPIVDHRLLQQEADRLLIEQDINAYLDEISSIEADQGPYAPVLPQQLLSLGQVYASVGNHAAAISQFKRAIHLTRINNGLNSIDQIPGTEGMIASLLAMGDFETADERHKYLYHIAQLGYDLDDPNRLHAMSRYADWNRRIYLAGVGKNSYNRLLAMYDTFTRMHALVRSTQGEYSLELLVPLQGLLTAHYLLARYDGDRSFGQRSQHDSALDEGSSIDETRVSRLRQIAFKRGKNAIEAMRAIFLNNPDAPPFGVPDTTIAMADWLLLNRKHVGAQRLYAQAWAELDEIPGGEEYRGKVLGAPVSLPVGIELGTGLYKLKSKKDPDNRGPGWVNLAYSINERGRASELAILEAHPSVDDSRITRIMRRAKREQFRPAFSEGVPTAYNLEKRHDFE